MKTLVNSDQKMMSCFREECLEQPERLRELLDAYSSNGGIRTQIAELKRILSNGRPVLWLGMGASWCSAWAAASWLSLLGRASFALEASEWLRFAVGVRDQVAGPMLVTTSGESAELVALAGRDELPRILVCNNDASRCWQLAQIRFPILAGHERANATKTYVNSTAACIVLGSELAGRQWQTAAEVVPDRFASSLERVFGRREEILEFCRPAQSVEFVGRGPAFAGSAMGALCVREMTAVRAAAISGGGFRHGPLLDVDSTHAAIIFAPGRTAELSVRLANDCIARGGRVVLVHDGNAEAAERLMPLRLNPLPEPWESLTSVLVGQALTLALIERSGTRYARTTSFTE